MSQKRDLGASERSMSTSHRSTAVCASATDRTFPSHTEQLTFATLSETSVAPSAARSADCSKVRCVRYITPKDLATVPPVLAEKYSRLLRNLSPARPWSARLA